MKGLIVIIAAVAVAVAVVAVWFALAGGEGDAREVPAPAPPVQFSIQGTVLSVTPDPATGLGSILVKGEPIGQSGVDYASLRVTKDTVISRQSGDVVTMLGFDALAAGQTVKVALVGPVAESYPVQGTAGTIVIVDETTGAL